ncbi:hypothetical protein AB0383_33600 [Amycolatopsis sp. NPDC051373]|uniref:hypothetical protein n=1 Tax=Amycolatopsis sp. NPDC051373 TaxID=3155801 RepID=UPI00344B88D0
MNSQPHRTTSASPDSFGEPWDAAQTILFVGTDPPELRTHCLRASATPADGDHGFAGLNEGVPIWLCDTPRQSWETLWPQLRPS